MDQKDFLYFDVEINNIYCPYVYPCIAKSKNILNKWIRWGENNNINIIPWPKLPVNKHNHFGNDKLNNVLLFPVNHQFNLSI